MCSTSFFGQGFWENVEHKQQQQQQQQLGCRCCQCRWFPVRKREPGKEAGCPQPSRGIAGKDALVRQQIQRRQIKNSPEFKVGK